MRVFGINDNGTFKEFVKTAFDLEHQEVVLEEWLEANPDGFLDDDGLRKRHAVIPNYRM